MAIWLINTILNKTFGINIFLNQIYLQIIKKILKILEKAFKHVAKNCLEGAAKHCKKYWYNPSKLIDCAVSIIIRLLVLILFTIQNGCHIDSVLLYRLTSFPTARASLANDSQIDGLPTYIVSI